MSWRFAVVGIGCLFHALSADAQQAPFGLLIAEQSRPSFVLLGSGARPAGMGGAFTALADDAAAASFNPAGLAFLVRPELAVVGSFRTSTARYLGFRALEEGEQEHYSDSTSRSRYHNFSFAALTLPFTVKQKSACVQAAFHRIVDFKADVVRRFVEYRQGPEPTEAYEQRVDQDGALFTYNLAGAVEVTDRLSVGLGLARWEGNWSFASSNAERPYPSGDEAYFRYREENTFAGWNWNAGLLLRYRYFNLGFAFRSGVRGDWKRISNWDTNVGVQPSQPQPERNILNFAPTWTVGFAFKPTDVFHVTVDYSHHQWSDMTFLPRHGPRGEARNFFDFRPVSASGIKDTESWRFGAEWTFFLKNVPFSLRGGYFREPLAVRVSSFGRPINTKGFTAGLGINVKGITLDVAWQRTASDAYVAVFQDPRVLVSGDLRDSAKGTLERREDRLVVGVVWQFASREALADLLRVVFVGPREK